MTEREAYIALNMIDGLGPVKVRSLVTALGSAQAVFTATADDLLTAAGVGKDLARKIVEQRSDADPVAEVDRAARVGARIMACCEWRGASGSVLPMTM